MKIPSLLIAIISLLLITLNTSCSKDSDAPKSDDQGLHDFLVNKVSEENIPGIIAAIFDPDGILLIESAGVRKKGSPEQITTDDHFHLGSCTKAMTSALLATLIADNEIQWETTLIEVFPEFEDSIHQDYHNVTLHQLVTHRSGVESNAVNWQAYTDLEIKERRLNIMKDNLKDASQIGVGEFNYSNLGYMIAGSMAERITGLSWETLMKDRLFEPLGMNSAGFGPPGTTGHVDQPWGHTKRGGKWQPRQLDNPEALGPAGTVHCSIEDWGKFIRLFLTQDNSTLLDRNQLDKLTEPVGDYACGWGVAQRQWADGMVITHNGSNTIWYITVWIAPEINRAFIAGTNSYDNNSTRICDNVIRELVLIDQSDQ